MVVLKKTKYRSKEKKLSLASEIPKKVEKLEYEKDFFKWVGSQADFLRKGEFENLDIENLIEEIESLGRSEKRTLQSFLEILLMHMLKEKYQKEKTSKSWLLSIKNSRLKVKRVLKDNPSLKTKLPQIINESYESARLDAAQETGLPEKTFPKKCEWTVGEIIS